MKRAGNLWPSIIGFDNLHRAARRAQLGKRYRDDVLAFNHDLERNLGELKDELDSRRYTPGAYRTFRIYEPKQRLISAAPYRDRVVHHALCNVIAPIFDRGMSPSSYANREGMGTRAALDHFRRCVQKRRYRFCLRADIVKYFPTIDHDILKAEYRRKVKCRDTLELMDKFADHANSLERLEQYFPGDDLLTPAGRRVGLPIGNLTSQLWANVYLNSVDHAMSARHGSRRYLRYVDDFALFSDERDELVEARQMLTRLLAVKRQVLHPAKTQITETRVGVNFLGFRFFPGRVRLRQENLRRARRRLRGLARAYGSGEVELADVKMSVQGWIAHASYGDTYRIRKIVFDPLVFARS